MSESEKGHIFVTFLLKTFFGAFFNNFFFLLLALLAALIAHAQEMTPKKLKIFFYECVLEF
jgi:hypothetical protein